VVLANIRDVAKKAGVSVSTVSRYINKNSYVKESTASRIQEVITELNYKPDAIAVGLSSKRIQVLGLIVPDITNPFFSLLAKSVGEAAKKLGYTVILCNSDGRLENELEHIEMLESKYVAGIILASNTFNEHSLIDSKTPIILVDRLTDGNFSVVTSNNRKGGRLATKHLVEIGCKKIAHLSGPLHIYTAQQRLRGYLDIVENFDWFSNDLIKETNYQVEDAYQTTLDLLRNEEIDGIFAGNDLIAIGCLKAIHSQGLQVPKDIAVIGFDGIPVTELVIPELSTISQNVYDMGMEAVGIIYNTIEKDDREIRFKELDVTLIKRSSTKRE
jgi:LacI family transcriptional regulator